MDTPPAADVLWWNASDYYILCPHCEEIHRHSVNWDGPKTRVPHCGAEKDYLCCFPFTPTDQAAYEIDKKRGRYVNICAEASLVRDAESDVEQIDVDILADEFARRAVVTRESAPSIADDAHETIDFDLGDGHGVFQHRVIGEAIHRCLQGRVGYVKRYLETSKEAEIFLHGRKADGNTMLILAAAEERPEMVELLLAQGAKVGAINNAGTTALMEAAFWGRLENAKLLLKHGADKDVRDNENRRAVDLAQPTLKNRRERYQRAGGDPSPLSSGRPGYVEDTYKRDLDRQNIVRLLLGHDDRKSSIVYGEPPTLSQAEQYKFARSATSDSQVLYGPIERYPVTDDRKTVARLERGGRFAPVGAMSGWSHNPIQSVRINNRQWTDEVSYISKVIGHKFPSHSYDRDRPGQFFACHAEKQLTAYFIDRHVFLPRDGEPNEALQNLIEGVKDERDTLLLNTSAGEELLDLRRDRKRINHELIATDDLEESKQLKADLKMVENSLAQLHSQHSVHDILALERRLSQLTREKGRHQDLMNMANAPPPVSLRAAVIFISRTICEDCIAFKNRVNKHFGLSIQLYEAR